MEKLSFDKLPQAVELLTEKITKIENLLQNICQPQNKEPPPPNALNFDQAHKFLQERGVFIERSTLYKKTSKGDLPFQKISGRLVFHLSDLTNWIESQFQSQKNNINNNAVVKAAQNKQKP